MRIKLLALTFACAFALAACDGGTATNTNATNSGAANAPTNAPASGVAGGPAPLAEMARVEAAGVEAKRGAGAGGEVRLAIAEGFHVNANPASEKYLIPTELKFEPAEGIEVGPVAYPESVERKFSFSEKPLAVYEGVARIGFAVKLRPDARAGEHALRARLRYQACDDEKCYPPKTVETSVPVRVN
jgi:hypothetical protein